MTNNQAEVSNQPTICTNPPSYFQLLHNGKITKPTNNPQIQNDVNNQSSTNLQYNTIIITQLCRKCFQKLLNKSSRRIHCISTTKNHAKKKLTINASQLDQTTNKMLQSRQQSLIITNTTASISPQANYNQTINHQYLIKGQKYPEIPRIEENRETCWKEFLKITYTIT